MKVRFYKGYWTIFCGADPVISFPSLKNALAVLRYHG